MNEDKAKELAHKIWGKNGFARTRNGIEVGYWRSIKEGRYSVAKGNGLNYEDAFHDAYRASLGSLKALKIAKVMKGHIATLKGKQAGGDFYGRPGRKPVIKAT